MSRPKGGGNPDKSSSRSGMMLTHTGSFRRFAIRTSLLGASIALGLICCQTAQAQKTYHFPTTFTRSYLPPVEKDAFDHFDAFDDGSDITNRFLLAHLSMAVYNNTSFDEETFDEYLYAVYSQHGVLDVEAFHDSQTGADGAIFVTDNAVIVACRGTSGGLTNLADLYADLDTRVKLVKVGNKEVGVHQGFWDAASSVYPEIWTRVATEMASGRKLWLTGHSLGGATAATLAFRLQYMDGLPVQGLMTYGAPRVGDSDFYKVVEKPIAGGRALTLSTQRFVIDGDAAATFFNDGLDTYGHTHAYHHFGITHTIFPDNGIYDFDYCSGELQMDFIWPFMIPWILTKGVHMEYEVALYQETAALLLEMGDDDIFEDISELPMD
jgi:hypothetical protein